MATCPKCGSKEIFFNPWSKVGYTKCCSCGWEKETRGPNKGGKDNGNA